MCNAHGNEGYIIFFSKVKKICYLYTVTGNIYLVRKHFYGTVIGNSGSINGRKYTGKRKVQNKQSVSNTRRSTSGIIGRRG
jgi:hypothetical protein